MFLLYQNYEFISKCLLRILVRPRDVARCCASLCVAEFSCLRDHGLPLLDHLLDTIVFSVRAVAPVQHNTFATFDGLDSMPICPGLAVLAATVAFFKTCFDCLRGFVFEAL